ncbi:MAG: MFS transporter [Chloroflexota bacterium]|nr:MFS transporter [Chloroflexota bacterium]
MHETKSTMWKKSYALLIGLFYFGQGYGFGIFSSYMSMYLNESFGLSVPETSGIIALIMIPWYLKPVWGIISDRFGSQRFGRRRPYLLIASLASLAGYLLIASITSYGVPFLLAATFTVMAVSMSDVILDALAVDVTPEGKMGLVQGVAWGFYSLGSVLMGLFTATMASKVGWSQAFTIGGVLLSFNCLLTLFIKEPPLTSQSVSSLEAYKEAFIGRNARPTWLCVLFSFLAHVPLATSYIGTIYLRQAFGLSVDEVGICLLVAALAGALGAFVWGPVMDRIGSKKAITIVLVTQVIIFMCAGLIPVGFGPLVIAGIAAIGFVGLAMTVAAMRVSMEFSPPRIAGSMFAIYVSIATLAQTLGATLIGYTSLYIGLRRALLVLAPFCGLTLIPLHYMTLYEPEPGSRNVEVRSDQPVEPEHDLSYVT